MIFPSFGLVQAPHQIGEPASEIEFHHLIDVCHIGNDGLNPVALHGLIGSPAHAPRHQPLEYRPDFAGSRT